MSAFPKNYAAADHFAKLDQLEGMIRNAIAFIDSQFNFDENVSIASNHLQNSLDVIIERKDKAP